MTSVFCNVICCWDHFGRTSKIGCQSHRPGTRCGHYAVAFVCHDCRPLRRRRRTARLKTARESGLWQRRCYVGLRHFFTPSRKSRTTLKFGYSSSRRCAAELLGVSERFAPGFLLATSEFRRNFLEPPLNRTWRTFFFFNACVRPSFPSDDEAAVCILLIAGRWQHIVKRTRQSRFFVFFGDFMLLPSLRLGTASMQRGISPQKGVEEALNPSIVWLGC